MKKYLAQKINGNSIFDYLDNLRWRTIVLYAANEIAQLVISDAENTKTSIKFVVDKNYKRYAQGYHGIEVCSPMKLPTLINESVIDGIIICSLRFDDEIFNELITLGISEDKVISFSHMIFN